MWTLGDWVITFKTKKLLKKKTIVANYYLCKFLAPFPHKISLKLFFFFRLPFSLLLLQNNWFRLWKIIWDVLGHSQSMVRSTSNLYIYWECCCFRTRSLSPEKLNWNCQISKKGIGQKPGQERVREVSMLNVLWKDFLTSFNFKF